MKWTICGVLKLAIHLVFRDRKMKKETRKALKKLKKVGIIAAKAGKELAKWQKIDEDKK